MYAGGQVMTGEQERDPAGRRKDKGAATEHERAIPKPPPPEELDEVSKDQALITDEWTGDNPLDKQGSTTR
jgi:hypothetical protein